MLGCKSEINALKLEASVGQLAGQSAAASAKLLPPALEYSLSNAPSKECELHEFKI